MNDSEKYNSESRNNSEKNKTENQKKPLTQLAYVEAIPYGLADNEYRLRQVDDFVLSPQWCCELVMKKCEAQLATRSYEDAPELVLDATKKALRKVCVEDKSIGEGFARRIIQLVIPLLTIDSQQLPIYYNARTGKVDQNSLTILELHGYQLVVFFFIDVTAIDIAIVNSGHHIDTTDALSAVYTLYLMDDNKNRTKSLVDAVRTFNMLEKGQITREDLRGDWLR